MSEIHPREKEIWRYLGYRGTEPDESVKEQIARCVAALQRECKPKHVIREFPLSISAEPDPRILLGPMEIRSSSLEKNLRGCGKALLFAATLGYGPDRLIRRASV